MKSLPVIISGIIIMIFGITFQFQGQGMVGPECMKILTGLTMEYT